MEWGDGAGEGRETNKPCFPKSLSNGNKIKCTPSEWWRLIVHSDQIHSHSNLLFDKQSDHFSRNIYRAPITCLGPGGLMIIKTHSISDLTGQTQPSGIKAIRDFPQETCRLEERKKQVKTAQRNVLKIQKGEIAEHKSLKKRGPSAISFQSGSRTPIIKPHKYPPLPWTPQALRGRGGATDSRGRSLSMSRFGYLPIHVPYFSHHWLNKRGLFSHLTSCGSLGKRLTSPHLSFSICKMGPILTSQDCCEVSKIFIAEPGTTGNLNKH